MSFKDIKGNERPIKIIQENILKRLQDRQSYIFSGPEGIGKNLTALVLSKALNCQEKVSIPCNKCPSCIKIGHFQHPDVHSIGGEDSESIKIDQIRQLKREINLRLYEGRVKVFIIDNAHKLTIEAANAFLKVLEEPPKNSLIILVTSKIASLLDTIVSRCKIIKFYSLPLLTLKEILKKDYSLDETRAHFLSFFSEGRIGRALRLKETDIFTAKNKIIDEFSAIKKNNNLYALIKDRGQFRGLLNVLAAWFRDVYMLKSGASFAGLVNLDRKDDLFRAAKSYSFDDLDNALNYISSSFLYLEANINLKLMVSNLVLNADSRG